jgi:hypothetical protein
MPDSHDIVGAASLIVGVTGHRMLREAELPGLRAQVQAFFLDLRARYPDLPLVLLSSLAEGSDQLAAQVAIELGVRVIAPLPMPIEQYRADFETAQPLATVESQRAQAEVLTLPLRGDNSWTDFQSRRATRPAVCPGRNLHLQSLPHPAGALGWPRVGVRRRHRAGGALSSAWRNARPDRAPARRAHPAWPDEETLVHHAGSCKGDQR